MFTEEQMQADSLYIDFFFSSRRRHTRCSRDWSSDVCSSDLLDQLLGRGEIIFQLEARLAEPRARRIDLAFGRLGEAVHQPHDLVAIDREVERLAQIGRASCRERVEIWGGDV